MEVVKSVTSEDMEKRDEDTDQVALETVEQEQRVHPPPHIVQSELKEENVGLDFNNNTHLFTYLS